jgi:glycosyltransferase involved in cell wall biosynthesis
MPMPLKIIAMAPNPWDGQWVNRQQILSRLGRMLKVVYSQGAWTVWDRHGDDYRDAPWWGGFEQKDNVLIDRPPRALLRWPRVRAIDRTVIALQARRMLGKRAPDEHLVAYLCHPMFIPYLDALSPDYVVYHCYDLYDRQPGWSAQLEADERRLLREADLIFSPTTMLSDELMKKVPCDARALPNGADVQAVFAARQAEAPEPDDLAAIPHPRVGYVGSIHPELDLALIAELARRRPAWHFVLIGPEQNPARLHASADYKLCRALPNVHLLGEKHRSQVPAYLLRMDANALFYRATADSWTHVAYPLKLHEYMACGHPVISVDLKMIREFEPLVRFATGADDWERALAQALAGEEGSQADQRRAIAARHSWDARVGVLQGWLDELPELRRTRLAR